MKFFYRFFIDLTNHLYLSKLIRIFATSKMSKPFIRSFAKTFNINIQESEKKLTEFQCLHDFFIRTLKKGSRPINDEPNSVVSPVDGFIEDIGIISENKNILVKGQIFSIKEMVGKEAVYGKYDGGIFMIIYLSPRDYHRIHSPVSGKVVSQWELGGKSYPVNKWGLKYGRAPLAKNYRRISEIKCNGKHVMIAKVGALFINTITLTHKNDTVEKGEEIGYFSFGSTVVLLFEKGSFQPEEQLKNNLVKMGQKIGELFQ
ncbi:phosphatidylserine decarboxylase [Calidifontibacillus erzurumensis]|uniref:phosphatidylserine decarboxylase n=1 Tax=Calidifontibacillus erzurumensis TaxID=2741433 RepID=UPI0035B51076